MDVRPPEEPCAIPNRAAFTLQDFDPATNVVVFDIAGLLADVNVTVNASDSVSGCMSGPEDPDCLAVIPRMGLPFGNALQQVQSFVRAM